MIDDPARHYQAVFSGRRSKAAGQHWEDMIEASCRHYSLTGEAEISKTPEPMRPLSRPNQKGQFMACFTKQAQPDYKGTLAGGRAVVFEAKHTDSDRMERKVITGAQEEYLDRHTNLGAECFVMVSFRFERFFRIPWPVFRDMKQHFRRKYITADDIKEYEVSYKNGVLQFLF